MMRDEKDSAFVQALSLLDRCLQGGAKLSLDEEKILSSFLEKFIADRELNQYLINNKDGLINTHKIRLDTFFVCASLGFRIRNFADVQNNADQILTVYKKMMADLPLEKDDKFSLKMVSIIRDLAFIKIPREIRHYPALSELNKFIKICKEIVRASENKISASQKYSFGFFNTVQDVNTMQAILVSFEQVKSLFNNLGNIDHFEKKIGPHKP